MARAWNWHDRALGMDRPIERRDFLNGLAVSLGATATSVIGNRSEAAQRVRLWLRDQPSPQDQPGYDPPLLNGLRGSHPGSFENAHDVTRNDFWKNNQDIRDTGERYDLVVVGGGISGLSAAWFYRARRPNAKILILDNHDDFGGHAKRNEFHLGGKLHLLNGGTLEIDSPRPYSKVADSLLKTLGIDPVALAKSCDRDELYPSLGLSRAVFFDRETFGEDRLVNGLPGRRQQASVDAWRAFLARAAVVRRAP
jgi:spermidine dehydrogenase